MYEFIMLDKPGGIILVVCATVGGVIGGVIGLSINRKVVRKAEEILSQIEELQKD
jgi:Na+/glutamate symporter